LQRLDRENPTPDSVQTRAKAKAKSRPYSAVAAYVPQPPVEPTPEPGAVSKVFQGRRVWSYPVYVILDYKGVLWNNRDFFDGIADDVRDLIRKNAVIDIVSWIGVKDRYAYFSDQPWADTTKTCNFFRNIEDWVQQSNFPRYAAPGLGYIRHVKVVDDRTGVPHDSKALREPPYRIDRHRTTGGKDLFAFEKGCAAIVDDHAGTCQACAEAGLAYYLVGSGRTSKHDRWQGDVRDFASPHHALVALAKDLDDPIRRYDLERRAQSILRPDPGIRYRTDCPEAADRYYEDANFSMWDIDALTRWKGQGGTGHQREKIGKRPVIRLLGDTGGTRARR
jgi:hypothetical protein